MSRLGWPLCLLALAAACGRSDEPTRAAAPPPAKERGPHEPGPGHTVNYPDRTPREIELVPWKIDAAATAEREPAPFEPPQSFDAIREKKEDRCPEGARDRLLAYDRDRLVLDLGAKEAAERFGPVEGLPLRQPHFALAAMLEGRDGAKSVEVWPDEGDPVALAAADLTAAPGRYVLQLTPKRGLKLLDAETGRTLARNVAAVRIVR